MRIFQIGFDNCGAAALNQLFQASGVRTLHGSGRYWRLQGHPAVAGANVQLLIHRNFQAGLPGVTGFDDFQAFFGMEFTQNGWVIENYRHFADLARDYPDARFLLNPRDCDAWLAARVQRDDGLYLAQAMERTGMSRRGVLNLWVDDFHRHHDMVRDYFRAAPDRLLEFDVDTTPVKTLARFVRPGLRIWPRHWRRAQAAEESRAA